MEWGWVGYLKWCSVVWSESLTSFHCIFKSVGHILSSQTRCELPCKLSFSVRVAAALCFPGLYGSRLGCCCFLASCCQALGYRHCVKEKNVDLTTVVSASLTSSVCLTDPWTPTNLQKECAPVSNILSPCIYKHISDCSKEKILGELRLPDCTKILKPLY